MRGRRLQPYYRCMTDALDNPRACPAATLSGLEESANGRAIQLLSADNPYLGDFSRRVAARLAGLPEPAEHCDLDDGDDAGITWKLLGRRYKLLLTIMVGAILYGATLYPVLIQLRPGASRQPAAQSDR